MLTEAIKERMRDSVLCWLATSGADFPNVSPKEVFTFYKDKIIIANIASPQSLKNILFNDKVCVSFIDVFVQKGWKIKGEAKVILPDYPEFKVYNAILEEMTKGLFPFKTVFEITPLSVKEIVAPSYFLYPETTSESQQIQTAKQRYGLGR